MSLIAKRRWKPARWKVLLASIIVIAVAAAVAYTMLSERRERINIVATATVSNNRLESDEGRHLQTEFESLAGQSPTRRSGPAVFMTGQWKIIGEPGHNCQIQLAVDAGSGW